MTNYNCFVGKHVQQGGLDIFHSRVDVSQIVFSQATESRIVVENGIDRFDQRLVNRFAFRGDDRHAQRFTAFSGVAHLAIQGVDSIVSIGRLSFSRCANESRQVFQILANVPFVHCAALGI